MEKAVESDPSAEDRHHESSNTSRIETPNAKDAPDKNVESSAEEVPSREPSTARLVVILAGLWLGTLLVVLDDTMLGTISGPISSSYNSLSKLSWIQTTFPLGASVSQPLSGHLTDIYGRRKGLMVCYTLFAVGTLLCGLAPNLGVFLLGRIIEGMGGGAIVSITAFVETDMVPLRKRALIEGLGNICYGVVFALGGVYGGGINEAIGWRWAFLIQPPIIVLNGIMVFFVVKIPQVKTGTSLLRHIDYFGGFTLVLALVLFQLALNSGGTSVGWASPMVIVCFVIALLSFLVFLFWDYLKATNPVLPLRHMLHRTVSASQISFFFASAANVSIIFYVPIYLQVLGYSTGASGLRFIPMAAGIATSSFVAGFIVERTARYFYVNIPVQICYVLGVVALCTMTQHTPPYAIFLYVTLIGIGNGGAVVTRLMGVLTSVPEPQQVVIQAASWTVESTGLALGITLASTVFEKISIGDLRVLLADYPSILADVSANFEALKTLEGPQRQAVVDVYMKATRGVFYLALAEIVVAALASFVMANNEVVDDPKEIGEATPADVTTSLEVKQ